MGKRHSDMSLFFELIQISLGHRVAFSRSPSVAEWSALRREAQRQALTGILFAGIEGLPKMQRPPRETLLPWYVVAEKIKEINRGLNREVVRVVEKLERDGFPAVLLKGQGVAALYPDPLLRAPGDIDLWLGVSRTAIMRYARRFAARPHTTYLHTVLPLSKMTEVEAHFTPSLAFSPLRNRRMQRLFATMAPEQFAHRTELPAGAGRICTPTPEFNRIYLLAHIYRHLFDEGIGLRQLLDYYYLLRQGVPGKDRGQSGKESSDNGDSVEAVAVALKKLGLYRFAQAVMYVEQEVFGLEKEYLLAQPDVRTGRFLLSEIMLAGNFGHYDPRLNRSSGDTRGRIFLRKVRRNWRFVRNYPGEVLCDPFFRLGHYIWRRWNGFL